MIGVVVLTHGAFGRELLRTAQDIVGNQEHAIGIELTPTMGAEGLAVLVQEAQKRFAGLEGVLYLADMLGGTPCNVVLMQTKDFPTEVVTGANVYMLLSVFKNRATMDLKTLAQRAADDGRKSIVLAKELLAKKGG